jgi:hypothetical protein
MTNEKEKVMKDYVLAGKAMTLSEAKKYYKEHPDYISPSYHKVSKGKWKELTRDEIEQR